MQRFSAFLVVVLTAASHLASAQSVDERKAAAVKWLERSELKIQYSGPYSSTFVADLKSKNIMFFNSPDRFCAARPVPMETAIDDDGMLVLTFDAQKSGCAQIRYTFDPISRVGVSRSRPYGSTADTPWSPSSSKINLTE